VKKEDKRFGLQVMNEFDGKLNLIEDENQVWLI
jgi:hypothetical protein